MKKLFTIILTAMLIFALALGVSAETSADITEAPITEAAPATEAPITEAAPEGGATTEAPATEAPSTAAPSTEAPAKDGGIVSSISPEAVLNYFKAHFEEIFVLISLLCSALYNMRKYKFINRSISKSNNNAVALAQEIGRYKDSFDALLSKYEVTAEENLRLKTALDQNAYFIKQAQLANVEFANELAELLCLANIPNAKKDELYRRHLNAVKAISPTEEVKEHDKATEA